MVAAELAAPVPLHNRRAGVRARKSSGRSKPGGRQSGGTSQPVRVRRGEVRVWFYRNESSIDVYVRPADPDAQNSPAPICFRISARDFIGR